MHDLSHHLRWRWRLLLRHPTQLLLPWLFFMCVVMLFPLALSVGAQWLSRLAPGIIWVALLLAVVLSLQHLFADDLNDGSLQQLLIEPNHLSSWVAANLLIYIVMWLLPMLLAMPLLALFLSLPMRLAGVLLMTVVLGLPSMLLVGAMLRCLELCAQQANALLMLLLLPLMVPVLILGTGTVHRAAIGGSPWPLLALMAAYALVAGLCVLPVCCFAIRLSVAETI